MAKKINLSQYAEKPLKDAIKELGASSKSVAAKLKRLGIKGERGSADSCPVANFLKKRFVDDEIEVDGARVQVNGVSIEAPRFIADFVDRFDSGNYPEVDENPDEPEDEDNK